MTLGHVGTNVKDANSQTLSVSLPDGQVGEHPGLSRGVGGQKQSILNRYLRESGSEVFFGDFWFKYAIIF